MGRAVVGGRPLRRDEPAMHEGYYHSEHSALMRIQPRMIGTLLIVFLVLPSSLQLAQRPAPSGPHPCCLRKHKICLCSIVLTPGFWPILADCPLRVGAFIAPNLPGLQTGRLGLIPSIAERSSLGAPSPEAPTESASSPWLERGPPARS